MYFAQIDNNNIVTNVIVADPDFVAGLPGTWIQTDINGISPINYASIGFAWNSVLNGFILPSPYSSWTLNNTNCKWDAPTPIPTDGQTYRWDEKSLSWKANV